MTDIIEALNVLFFPKPKSTGTGGETSNEKNVGQGSGYGIGIYVLIVIALLALLAGINYAISQPATVQPAVTTQDASLSLSGSSSDGGNGGNGLPVDGTATPTQNGKETTGTVLTIENPSNMQDLFQRWGTLISIDDAPQTFKIQNTDIYVTNFKLTSNKVSGVIENRGNKVAVARISFRFVNSKGYAVGVNEVQVCQINKYNNCDGVPEKLSPNQKAPFETMNDPEITQIITLSKFVHPVCVWR